jgi:hypothetical protein
MRPRRALAAVVIAGTVVLTVVGQVATAESASLPPKGPVTANAPVTTPHLLPTASPAQQIRQLVQCKGTMFAVGSFSTIEQGTKTYARTDAISFSATAPYTMSSWAPKINGQVNSIAFNDSKCADAYIGGTFTSVNGTAVKYLAEVNTQTGAVVKAFGHSASKEVDTLLGVDGHIFAGGDFKTINGSTADPYLASLNPVTGKDDGYLKLHISGSYEFTGVEPNATKIYNQALSHGGTLDLVMGDFTSAGGLPRQQIFMLSLGKTKGTVTGWTSPEWDGSDGNLPGGYPYQCATNEPFYIRAAAWSPSDQVVYLAATGYHPWNLPITGTRTGLCDAASAFPATQKQVFHLWINYTGCDSLYAAAADQNTAYFAGHERWSENSEGCDAQGPGGINAPGFEGLSPADGSLIFNPTRARGLGADDMIVTSAGLWIASDDYDNSQTCAATKNVAGICLLPY